MARVDRINRRTRVALIGLFLLMTHHACTFWQSDQGNTLELHRDHTNTQLLELDHDHVREPRDVEHGHVLGNVSTASISTEQDLSHKITWPKNTYNTYAGKGCKLYEMLQRKKEAPGSAFSEIQQLEDWGWKNSGPETTDDRLRTLLGSIEQPLNELGLGITTGDGNINIETTHSESTTHNGKMYPPTQAKFYEVYNPKQGVIIAYRNYGPDYMRKNIESIPDDTPLPDLHKWSDGVYLTWSSVTTPVQRMSLRYIVRLNVQNEDTNYIVAEALKKVGGISSGTPPAWPGYTFKPDEGDGETMKAFEAVLGTPNASGIAWLLLAACGTDGEEDGEGD